MKSVVQSYKKLQKATKSYKKLQKAIKYNGSPPQHCGATRRFYGFPRSLLPHRREARGILGARTDRPLGYWGGV